MVFKRKCDVKARSASKMGNVGTIVNKEQLIKVIIDVLEEIHRNARCATQTAIDAATDEETVPEHKYDTLALEASYLAHGQAVRLQECESDILRFKRLSVKCFEPNVAIRIGALVELIDAYDNPVFFFMGPCAGGVSVRCQNKSVALITPQAPLGNAMLGKYVGDEIELNIAGKQSWYEVVNII